MLHIKNIVKKLSCIEDHWKVGLLKSWPSIVGKLNARITLETIQDDTVIIGVADSCWLQELYMLSPLLCSLINQSLDTPRIKTVRFKKISNVQSLKKIGPIAQQSYPQSIHIPLSLKEECALKNIVDQELQDALKSFHHRCIKKD